MLNVSKTHMRTDIQRKPLGFQELTSPVYRHELLYSEISYLLRSTGLLFGFEMQNTLEQ